MSKAERPDIEAIEARLSKATPAPWWANGTHPTGAYGETQCVKAGTLVVAQVPWSTPRRTYADAALIANAPADLGDLLAYVRDLEERAGRLALERADLLERLKAQGAVAAQAQDRIDALTAECEALRSTATA